MIIYGSSISPFVRKVMVFAAEKGIEVENVVPRPGREPDPEFREASPFGKIPALRDGDFTVPDSSAIVAYMDALRPEPRLIPQEPKARARVVWLEEFVDTILSPAGARLFFNRVVAPTFLGRPGDEAVAAKAETEELPPLFDYVESIAPEEGYLVDDQFTLADIAIACPYATLRHAGYGPDAERHPKTIAFVDRILARPSFADLLTAEREVFARVRQRSAANTTQ